MIAALLSLVLVLVSLVISCRLVSGLLIPACVSCINPCLAVQTLFGLLLVLLDYPSSLALWILFVDQRPTLALGLLFVLPVLYLFADALTPPVFLIKSWNKACKSICTSHVSFALLHWQRNGFI